MSSQTGSTAIAKSEYEMFVHGFVCVCVCVRVCVCGYVCKCFRMPRCSSDGIGSRGSFSVWQLQRATVRRMSTKEAT